MSDTILSQAPAVSRDTFLDDVLTGLSQPQKSLPPKYFYDKAGSELFEAICLTPEYYPTRTETALLAKVAPALSPWIERGCVLVEFGSGASDKTRLLLDAMPQISTYMPIDISADALAPAVDRIKAAYPAIAVTPVEADFTQPMTRLDLQTYPAVLGFFPGSTIGNFTRSEAAAFLKTASDMLGSGALFLVGADMVKDPAILIAAYDDTAGVTAAFNLNVLQRINTELGADFDVSQFAHRARWNAELARMEMHLESLSDQVVHIRGQAFSFRRGETIHTENSHKFTVDGFEALAQTAGWMMAEHWVAPDYAFAAFLLKRG
ncbi:MAG: L-histidine N(alpha)-methyltransferase [Caulobacteraceae bacterium]